MRACVRPNTLPKFKQGEVLKGKLWATELTCLDISDSYSRSLVRRAHMKCYNVQEMLESIMDDTSGL